MLGGVYSDQRCPLCGSKFINREPKGLFCPKHSEQQPTKLSVIFQGIHKRFRSYDEARRFLTGLRYEFDKGTFDPRDYRSDRPLGFMALAGRYIEIKKNQVSYGQFDNIRRYMRLGMEAWGHRNIKGIGYAEIEDLLIAQCHLSDKSKANMLSVLHDFWMWLRKRRILEPHQLPDFPEVRFELGWRNIISKETQPKYLKKSTKLPRPGYIWQSSFSPHMSP